MLAAPGRLPLAMATLLQATTQGTQATLLESDHLVQKPAARILQRLDLPEPESPSGNARARSRPFRDFDDADAAGDLAWASCEVLLACALSAFDVAAITLLALPRLWGLSKLAFATQVAISVVGGSSGALVVAIESGLWGKTSRLSSWFRASVILGLVGLLGAAPFVIGTVAVLALLKRDRDAWSMLECRHASRWMASARLPGLVPTLLLQACCAAACDSLLWLCVLTGLLVTTSIAVGHDSASHTYCRLHVIETAFDDSWEDSIPLVTGALESPWSAAGALLLVFRAAEILASVTRYALFHAGTVSLLAVAGVGFGGPLLLAIELALHAGALWYTTGTLGDPLTLLTSCVFIPKPLLREGTQFEAAYVVKAAVLILAFFPAIVAGALRMHVGCVFLASSISMWLLLGVVKRNQVRAAAATGEARELADKLKNGSVRLQPLQVSGSDLQDPQLLEFCRAFASHYYDAKFDVQDGAVRLDLTGQKLGSGAALSALHLLDPLMAGVSSYEIDLDGAEVGDVGIQVIGKHLPPRLLSLEANLGGTQIGDEGFASFARRLPHTLVRLEVGINSTRVGDQGLAALAYHLPAGLKSLDVILYNTQVADQGVAVLASRLPKGLQSLRAGLFNTRVGDQGVTALAEGLPRALVSLKAELSGTKITDKGAVALADNLPTSVKAFEVNVAGTAVREVGLNALSEAVPQPTTPRRGGGSPVCITPPASARKKSWLSFGCV